MTIDVKDAAGTSTPIEKPNANGQAAMAASRPVVLASDQSPIPVTGIVATPSSSFTTTALTTAWTSNQLIANNATAGSVTALAFTGAARVNGGSGSVRRARVKVASDTGFAGQTVVLKLYRDAPTPANGDRDTWLTNESGFLGQIPVTLDQHFNDFEAGNGQPSVGSEINFACAGGSTTIYGLLVAAGPITPQAGSKAITATLEILQN